MKYPIEILQQRRRDHIATANALELKMADMLDPNTDAAIDNVRKHRLKAEELQRAIIVLDRNNVTNIEDAR
jgi:hypothetical protein